MKNLILALIACILTGLLTFLGLGFATGKPAFSLGGSDGAELVVEADEDENDEDYDESDEDSDEDYDEDDEDYDESDEDSDEDYDEDDEDYDESDEDSDEDDGDDDSEDTKEASSSSSSNSTSASSAGGFDKVNVASVTTDYKTWKSYNTENIQLAYDFTPFDENGSKISKKAFLEMQKTGEYIPIKGDGIAYKLVKLSDDIDNKIKKGARSNASKALYYFEQEGRVFPAFEAKDLNGTTFSNTKTNGKLLIVKCWFVRCTICVKEFPELNEIYDKYEGNDKIEFLSFAFDKEEALKTFLTKKEFRYPVIPNQQNFIMKDIKAKQFPLHIVVDKNGKILKMVNNVEALEHFIEENI